MFMNNFYTCLRHTDVIDVNKKVHELPPDNGPFEEFRVSDFFCPDDWSKDGVFIKVREGDPLWFDFRREDDYDEANWDCACMLSVQKVNPLTGLQIDMERGLSKDPKQTYLRLPEQLYLDGYAHDGRVYQFVITKAGLGIAVNETVLPIFEQDSHAVALAFFRAKNRLTLPQRPEYGVPTNPMWFSPLHTPNCGTMCEYSLPSKNSCRSKPDVVDGRIDKTSYTLASKGFRSFTENQLDTSLELSSASVGVNDVSIDGGGDLLEGFVEHEPPDKGFEKVSMAGGGRIDQLILNDHNSADYYEEKPAAVLKIYFAFAEQFEAIMKRGHRQDAKREDKFVHSGKVGETQVPLTSK